MEPAPRSNGLSYVLVTPARNEEQLIEYTLRSVIAQTHLPLRWVIVSDGSTDATDRIVQGYARQHGWIELLRVDDGEGRNFARKALAFNSGCERLRHLDFDVIGNLDADLSFGAEHFRSLLQRFANLPDLGVAGSAVVEEGRHYDYRFTDIHHVAGACQLFRRACLEEIGGYVAVARGDIDRIAVTTARLKGWQTRTFPDTQTVHHRKMGTANQRTWQVWFRRGEEDYSLGSHPVWHLGRSLYQFTARPYVLGGLLLLAGYAYCLLRRAPRSVSPELVAFYRGEQRRRLTEIGTRFMPRRAARLNEPAHAVPLGEALDRLERWIEAHDYKGYEPFDGLSSPLRALTFDNHFLKQMLLQLGRQSPINLRPLLGIKPLESTKGRGYMAWGYLALLRRTGQPAYAEKARACLEWLMRNKSPLSPEYCWGNHFDYASRAGDYAKHEPIIVWTALIGQAFVDGYEILGDDRYLDVARSICSWILRLPREQLGTGICLSYLATRQLSVHNANLLGAAMLARTARHTGAAELTAVARAAVEYSCSRQRRDGSWFYADDPSYQWIDNFHTGYNLDSIKCYIDSSGDETFRPHLNRGIRYYKSTFFAPDGLPKYYHDRTYPIDIQCAAQAIETLAKCADVDGDALAMATRVARWTIANMQDSSGYFFYRHYPFMLARTPMLHWGQATMYRALAYLSLQRQRVDG